MARLLMLLTVLLSVLCVFVQADPRTYWVDSSCTEGPGWSEWLEEAFKMAEAAARRLGSDTDTDFANVFKRIYRVDKSDTTLYKVGKAQDTAYNLVHHIMSEIGTDFTETTDRLASDVRFYCNNGARWVNRSKPNKPRMHDRDNLMAVHNEGCSTPRVLAFTVFKSLKPIAGEPEQNNQRSTIDLCDQKFNVAGTANDPTKLSDIPENKDLGKFSHGVQDLRRMMPLCLLHELTHISHYATLDMEPKPYGWTNFWDLDTKKSLKNADNYAYLGLFASLADRPVPKQFASTSGLTLPRPWTDPTSAGGKRAEEETKIGKIKLERHLTRFSREKHASNLTFPA